jgi:hypothetical protein
MMCSAVGQVRVAVQPGFNSFGGEMQLMPDNTLRVIGIASDDWWYGMSFVSTIHFNTGGQMLSVKMFPEIGLEEAGDLRTFPTRDGHTIVVADLTGCDFGVPVTLGCISETDAIVWHRSPDFETEVSDQHFRCASSRIPFPGMGFAAQSIILSMEFGCQHQTNTSFMMRYF